MNPTFFIGIRIALPVRDGQQLRSNYPGRTQDLDLPEFPVLPRLFLLLGPSVRERFEQLEGQGEDDRGVLLDGDLRQGSQEPKLEGLGIRGNDIGGLGELARCLELAFGMDDFGPAFALGLGLLGDGPDHVLRKIDMLHLDHLDLDAPRVGALVDDLLELGVELLPLRKEVVKTDLPEDAPERGLGELGSRVEVILDIDYALDRLHNPEIKYRIDLDRDIVPGDDVLRGDVLGNQPEADPDHAVDGREHQDDPRALGFWKHPAQPEDHAPLVFPEDFDGVQDVEDRHSNDDDGRR